MAARLNEGAGSIQHSRNRVAKFRESFDVLKESLDALAGYAPSEDGELALRRAAEGAGAVAGPSSTGAPPATEAVAAE
eukprot:6867258-Pyramimonas_sp.AAC.1